MCATGTLDAHASGKLSGSKLDSAMAGLTAEYAARGKLRNLTPEQESSLKLKVLEAQACFACPLAEFLVSGPFHEHADVVCYVRSCRTQSIRAGPRHIVLCCAVLCHAVLLIIHCMICSKLICRCVTIMETDQRVRTAGCFMHKPESVLHQFYPQSRYKHLALFHLCTADTSCLPVRHPRDA